MWPAPTRPPVPIPPTHSTSPLALAELLGLDITTATSRVHASESTVTGIPAVQAGIDMIAHAVATMLSDPDVIGPDGRQLEPDELPDVVARPTVLLTPFEFWTQAVDCVMKRGNYPAVLADFDTRGFARQVVPSHPDAVSLDDSSGFPIYTIGAAEFSYDEIVHVRHGAPVGSFWGCGIVERYRLAVERQLLEAEYGRTSMASGGVPSAVIQLDKATVSNPEAEQVQERWIERHGSGARKPAVIGKALNITPISWSPEDAEFIETRRFSVAEAALICGLDPADLGASIGGSGLTYANLTERQLARILASYLPWLTMFEQAWSDLLPPGVKVRGSVEALLRSSTRERYETYAIGQSIGLYDAEGDELRQLERRPARSTTTTEGDNE